MARGPAAPVTAAQLRECRCCGLLQDVPPLAPNTAAVCVRCGVTIRRARADPLGSGLALSLAALLLLVVVSLTTLMRVETAGISANANLFSGPEELAKRGMPELGLAVLFTTVLAPYAKLIGTIYVLAGLRARTPPHHLRQLFVWVEWLAPWSMIEVFVFGVFVAYVKLGDLVHITLEEGLYALLALTVAMIWADAALDRSAVWEELDRRDKRPPPPPETMPPPGARSADVVTCEYCGLVHARAMAGKPCVRCESMLHERKPNSLSRSWALVISAAVMYIPANLYPVLTVVQNGAGAPSTIMGGVEELIQSKMYPLAALVFFASVLVPMVKVVGLAGMLFLTQTHRDISLKQRTRLYLFVCWIGRWSMIDIFMEALLGALVRFGAVVTIVPGMGAIAFCSVVILTMLAAESFDPRLMWDQAERDGDIPATEARPGPATLEPAGA